MLTTSRFPSADARGRWLLDFLRVDFEKLTPGQLVDLRTHAWEFGTTAEGTIVDLSPDDGLGDDGRPSESLLRELQDNLANGIQVLREGDGFWSHGPVGGGIARSGVRIIRSHREGTFRDLFIAAMVDSVQDSWDRLRVCPRCETAFYKVGKQQYCSPVCSRKTRWDTFKSKRRKRDYRAEREAALKKRLGPKSKVKPGRRKPSTKGDP